MCRLLPPADRLSQDETLEHYAGYTEEEIEPVVELMVDYLARPVVHEAFFKKYASKKFLKGTRARSTGSMGQANRPQLPYWLASGQRRTRRCLA